MIQTIQQLYPRALINPENIDSLIATHHILHIKEQIIAIPKEDIPTKELTLLSLLVEKQPNTRPKSHWQKFLEQSSPNIPIITGNLQVLHIEFRHTKHDDNLDLWLSTFKEAFPAVIEWFPIALRRFTILLKIKSVEDLDVELLHALIQTLDTDFDTSTRVIIGYTYPVSLNLPIQYQHELVLVEHTFRHDASVRFETLTPVLIRQIGRNTLQHNELLQPLQQIIRQNNEYSSLIQALFEHQGNLSQAAEQLYIHRNTLTYRLQKFYKETGMQLQHLPDLVICYLCLF
ncbi:helix-turn-helix domain-containing protein [Aerococcaceae bacterium zg-ZJ1578]|uniref:PucR family transcriptional regulator n=1 Tax=Aerococcaceae bacterium zg-252 TaxID=2796928 RepID=UPI001A3093F1|nr:helix-turn-helix domain-containing protein [Aerococcaceae bacterium zg-1578]MBR7928088.1 helix-turn-helix domain-containing protein [Aerococcaceae bacterium zg-ZUI334]